MPDSFEERYQKLLASPNPEKVLVLPRSVGDIIQAMREGDQPNAEEQLVHRFYELLAAESPSREGAQES